MTIEELKYRLNALEERVSITDNVENEEQDRSFVLENIVNHRKRTALEELSRKYRFFIFLALAMVPITQLNHILGEAYVRAAFGIYFLVCAIMDMTLLCRIKKIDLTHMSVSEVARAALSARKLHHLYQLILIPLALVVVALMAYSYRTEPGAIWGMVFGGIVGGFYGWRVYKQMMRNYKRLTQEI